MKRAFATQEEAMANKVKDLLFNQLLASAQASPLERLVEGRANNCGVQQEGATCSFWSEFSLYSFSSIREKY